MDAQYLYYLFSLITVVNFLPSCLVLQSLFANDIYSSSFRNYKTSVICKIIIFTIINSNFRWFYHIVVANCCTVASLVAKFSRFKTFTCAIPVETFTFRYYFLCQLHSNFLNLVPPIASSYSFV